MKGMKGRWPVAALVALAAASAAACAKDRGGAETPASYALATVNGKPLPYTQPKDVEEGDCRPTFARGDLRLESGNTYTLTYDVREACMKSGVINTANRSVEEKGIFERQGDALRFYVGPAAPDSSAEGPVMQGTLSVDTLSLYNTRRGVTFRFVRGPAAATGAEEAGRDSAATN